MYLNKIMILKKKILVSYSDSDIYIFENDYGIFGS